MKKLLCVLTSCFLLNFILVSCAEDLDQEEPLSSERNKNNSPAPIDYIDIWILD